MMDLNAFEDPLIIEATRLPRPQSFEDGRLCLCHFGGCCCYCMVPGYVCSGCAAGVVIMVAAAPAIAATSVASTPKNMDLASSLYWLAFNSASPLLLGVLRVGCRPRWTKLQTKVSQGRLQVYKYRRLEDMSADTRKRITGASAMPASAPTKRKRQHLNYGVGKYQ